MMAWKVAVLGCGLAFAGCATGFYGTAPTKDGALYVAGEHNGDATVWKCPSTGKGECQPVTVEFK